MIKTNIANKPESLPVGHSDRLMSSARQQVRYTHPLISAHAPTLQADSKTKDAFCSELSSLIKRICKSDKIVIMGDFNARVGKGHTTWPGVLGRHGIGNCNDNGLLLIELCAEHALAITNTVFQKKARLKTTWRQPHSKDWHLLDYIVARQKDAKDVQHTRVIPSVTPTTD